ncbi:hypothetical protein GUITHDRAFT_142260 [Guillardia theta CCMP2712]|uniref:PDZ domain-containing protein n=1 Tax=Guillardia theta (strain CCMP2712) TaxID=905079 RepID=L1IXV5_GUITC|nr:hypothetical protein GUITHDRAFT_142260 [Guillardia theta CCMP2712]EKX41103.1 hypothetical protein GUITHDRAFT_142260 [Guillardia theta CCMP2712]|eukprot:XP_005828083.1 hypothetical protein GUITHDRAFT_142260 [Guillardia theta CCMP2712]
MQQDIEHLNAIIATKDACLLNFSKTLRDAEQRARDEREQLKGRIGELERELGSALQKLAMAGRLQEPSDHSSRAESKHLETALYRMQEEMAGFQQTASKEIMNLRRAIQEREETIYQLKMDLMKTNRLLTVSKAQRHEHYMDTINTNFEADNDDEDREGEPDVSWKVAGVQAKIPGEESDSEALKSAREVMTTSMSSSGTFNSKPMFEHGDRFVEVNGINVEDSTIEEIKNILRSSDQAIPVKIRKSTGQLVSIKARYPDKKKLQSDDADAVNTRSPRAGEDQTERSNVTLKADIIPQEQVGEPQGSRFEAQGC